MGPEEDIGRGKGTPVTPYRKRQKGKGVREGSDISNTRLIRSLDRNTRTRTTARRGIHQQNYEREREQKEN